MQPAADQYPFIPIRSVADKHWRSESCLRTCGKKDAPNPPQCQLTKADAQRQPCQSSFKFRKRSAPISGNCTFYPVAHAKYVQRRSGNSETPRMHCSSISCMQQISPTQGSTSYNHGCRLTPNRSFQQQPDMHTSRCSSALPKSLVLA